MNEATVTGPFADLSSHRRVRLGTYWARNANSLREENAFPLVGEHLGMVGLTGLELGNRLRGQRWTVGDYPG